MNVNKYSFLRLLLLVKGFFPSLLFILLPKKRNRIIFSSLFNRDFSHNSRALFVHFIDNYSEKYEVKFVVSDPDVRYNLKLIHGDYFVGNSSLKEIIYILRAKTWVVSSFETPVGGLFLRIGRNVFHLGHGAPVKAIGLLATQVPLVKRIYYRLISNNFTLFFSNAPVFDEPWQRCLTNDKKRVVRAAQARNDALAEKTQCKLIDAKHNILYAPTWRPYGETKIFPFSNSKIKQIDDFLEGLSSKIYLRVHPNFETTSSLNLQNIKNIVILTKDKVEDVNTILNHFDLLITDYSSIYIDYLLLGRPILFLPYDYEEYRTSVGFSIDYLSYSPGPKPKDHNSFMDELYKLITDKEYYRTERVSTSNYLNSFHKEHSKQNAELIFDLMGN